MSAPVTILFNRALARGGPEMASIRSVLAAVQATVAATLKGDDGVTVDNAPASVYFAVLMSMLESTGTAHAYEIFFLQSLLLPHIAPELIQRRFDAMASLFLSALQSPVIVKETATLRALLSCLITTLKCLEPSPGMWDRPTVVQLFNALVSNITAARPKIRKAACAGVLDILQLHYAARCGSASNLFAAALNTVLRAATARDQTAALQLMPLLRDALPLHGAEALTTTCDALLHLPALGQARLTATAFVTLATMLESPRARLSVKMVSRMLAALLSMTPSPEDHVSATEYAYLLAAALTRLANMERMQRGVPVEIRTTFAAMPASDAAAGALAAAPLAHVSEHLAGVVRALVSIFEASRVTVHHAAANALSIVLATALDAGCIMQAVSATRAAGGVAKLAGSKSAPVLVTVIEHLAAVVQFKYQPSWPVSVPVLALLFRLLGADAALLTGGIVTALVSLRDALSDAAAANADDEGDGQRRERRTKRARVRDADSDDGGSSDDERAARARAHAVAGGVAAPLAAFRMVNAALAAAVRSMGAAAFVALVGLTLPGAPEVLAGVSLPVAERRVWVLSLLHDNAAFAPCPISFCTSVLLPAIRACLAAATAAVAAHLPRNARAQRSRAALLWSLLPPTFVAPSDFATGFDVSLAKTLTQAVSDMAAHSADMSVHVARALETVITRSRAAVGLPPVRVGVLSTSADDAEEDDFGDAASLEGGHRAADAALTVVAGGRVHRAKRGGADDSDDSEHEESGSDADMVEARGTGRDAGTRSGFAPRSVRGEDDGATTVFGAGGVSVFGGGGNNPAGQDARHMLLQNAISTRKDTLPDISKEAGQRNIATLQTFAKNIVPVLFNVYETCVVALNETAPAPDAAPIPGSAAGAVTQERARKVLDAIAVYVSIAPAELLASMADRLLKLITTGVAAQAAAAAAVASAKAAATAAGLGVDDPKVVAALKSAAVSGRRLDSMLSLSLAVLPSLTTHNVGAAHGGVASGKPAVLDFVPRLYTAVKPAVLDDSNTRVQKRAYAVLASLLSHEPAFVRNSHAACDDVVALLRGSLMTVSASCRRSRLVCFRALVGALDMSNADHTSLMPALLSEVMLCTKDTNARVRAAAFVLLLAMARRMESAGPGDGIIEWDTADAAAGSDAGMESEEEDEAEGKVGETSTAAVLPRPIVASTHGGNVPPASLTEFFRMLLAGLAAGTPHMRSAALRALSCCVYEFSDREVMHAMLPPILRMVLLLLHEKSREVITSVVGFVKVVISSMPPAALVEYVPEIVTALMTWNKESKNRIRAKIRTVLERLVRKFGFDVVAPHVPSSDAPLLAHMRKQAERRERRRLAAVEGASSVAGGGSGATAASAARTAFEELVGAEDEEDEEEDDDVHADLYADDDMDSNVGDNKSAAVSRRGGRGDAASAITATSVARSWGVVGSRAAAGTAAANTGRGSFMSAVTADMRRTHAGLATAPLPAVGSIIDVDMAGGRKRLAGSGKSAVSAITATTAKTAKTGKTTGAGAASSSARGVAAPAMLRADDDTPMDLMDASAMRHVVGADPLTLAALERQRRLAARADALHAAAGTDLGDGVKIGADGRIVVTSVESDHDASDDGGEEEEEGIASKRDKLARRKHARGFDKGAVGDEAGAGRAATAPESSSAARHGGHAVAGAAARRAPGSRAPKGGHLPAAAQGWGMKKAKGGHAAGGTGAPGERGSRYSGAQYRADRAGGDVLQKGAKFEPFAYVPLGAKGSSAASVVGKFDAVVASTTKSARAANRQVAGGRGGAGASAGSAPAAAAPVVGQKRRRGA